MLIQVVGRFDAQQMALIALAAVSTAMFHSISGFAGGLLLAIALAPIIGVKAIVPVMAVALLVSHASRVWVFRRGFRSGVYWSVMATGIPFCIIGAAVYSSLPVHAIAAILGAFLVASVPLRRMLERRDFRVGRNGLLTVGAPFGILAGSTIGAGMILAPFMLGVGLVGEALMGTMAAIALTINVLKTIAFSGFAVLDLELAVAGFLIGLCTIPGNFIGHWVVTHTPVRVHILLLEAVIAGGGVYFMWEAAAGFGLL